MGKSNLLKDAIADAKAVRETALANARLRMQEAFTPRLQSMISAKLQNEVEGEEEDMIDEPVETLPGDEPSPEVPVDEVPAEEIPAEVPAEAPVDAPAPEIPVDEVPAEVPAEEIPAEEPIDVEPEVDIEIEPGVEDEVEEEGFDELDLESIIRELDAEADMEDDIQEPVFTEGEDKEEKGEEEEEKLEETKFDLTAAVSNKTTTDVTPDLKGEKGPTPGTQPESPDRGKPFSTIKGADSTPDATLKQNSKNAIYEEEGEEDEEINIDEILRELEEADVTASVPEELPDASNPFKTMNEQLKTKVVTLTKDLKEHRQVIKFLKSKLNEVNLLNAKLLFSTKLFRDNNLNNEQKYKIVENFDRAITLREVKLVYSTIAQSLKTPEVKKPSTTVKKITENIGGGASKPVASTKPTVSPKTAKTIIKENIVDENGATRLQKLAGIKNKKKIN